MLPIFHKFLNYSIPSQSEHLFIVLQNNFRVIILHCQYYKLLQWSSLAFENPFYPFKEFTLCCVRTAAFLSSKFLISSKTFIVTHPHIHIHTSLEAAGRRGSGSHCQVISLLCQEVHCKGERNRVLPGHGFWGLPAPSGRLPRDSRG